MKILNTEVSNKQCSTLFEFTQGLDVDKLLYKHEIRVQKIWVTELKNIGFLSHNENLLIQKALSKAKQLMENDLFSWRVEDEDIHMNIERFVSEECGDVGKKMHYGRSRNDLIATTLRLFINESVGDIYNKISTLKNTINKQSESWLNIIVPGMTHLQFGQPILLGHMFSSHSHSFKRDMKRLSNSQSSCMDCCPLGAAAFAGTHININLKSISQSLNFTAPLQHSYDAVGDRDFILESLSSFSTLAVHLTRLVEDIMYWSSTAIGLLEIPKEYSTGSSIMPNKRNPDVPELIRAKMARVITCYQEAAIIVKAVTPSYGTDLHELKRTFVLSFKELKQSLFILDLYFSKIKINKLIAESLLNKGHLLATEVANYLAEKGVPFREAYSQSASLVAKAEKQGKQIHELANIEFSCDFSFHQAIEKRQNTGGTSYNSAKNSIAR